MFLPVELLEEILLNLRCDFPTLKSCSLVSHTFRCLAQQHIFSELSLFRFPHSVPDLPHNEQATENHTLCSVLLQPSHTHLLSYVRHLKLHLDQPPQRSIPDPSFSSVLDLIVAEKLTKITIFRRSREDPLSSATRLIRQLLYRAASLLELDLQDGRVLASYLNACSSSVRVLTICGTRFVEDEPPMHSWVHLQSLLFTFRMIPECLLWMMRGGSLECPFPRLKHLFIADEVKDVELVNEILRLCHSSIRSLFYTPYGYSFSSYPSLCRNSNGNVIEVAIPSSIRLLAINCPVILKPAARNSANPFSWLNHIFRKLSHQKCSLEVVHIKFLTTSQIEQLSALFPGGFPIDVCFSDFDVLLSDSERFPHLKKVYLTVGRHYLTLFSAPEVLPRLYKRGLLSIVYEEILGSTWYERKYHVYHGPALPMENMESHPWNSRAFLSQ